MSLRFNAVIDRACERYGVEKVTVLAVIRCESGFRADAVSPSGAVGLMQIMPGTARFIADRIGLEDYDLFSAADNVELGTAYLKYLYGVFDSEKTVFAAYNAGEGVVKEWLDDPLCSSDGANLDSIPYKETRKYVDRVIFYRRIYKLFGNFYK